MGAPTNLSDQGAGEMSAAARMHAEPMMRLNQLTRWYVMTAVFFLIVTLGCRLIAAVSSLMFLPLFQTPFLLGSVLLFFGGVGIKFLPGSLGGNPHVYSLRLALWSYWLFTAGTLVWFGFNLVFYWLNSVSNRNLLLYDSGLLVNLVSGIGPALLFVGSILLAVNFWKTMQSRV